MLKQGTFVNKKFNRFLLGNIWGILAYCINLMIDSLISGNQLGEVSLQAVSIIYPLFSIAYFFANLVPLGGSILFGKYIGDFKKEEAYRAAGVSLLSSILISVLISVALWIIKVPFLNYYECTGNLFAEASAYYDWLILYVPLYSISLTFYFFIVTDGESDLISVANILSILANVVLSIVLSKSHGISGLGMATCIGVFLKLIAYIFHFFKKSNSIKFKLCLDMKILCRSVILSSSSYMYYLFIAVVDIVLNKIIIATCGMEYIPAYSVVNLAFGVYELYESLSNSSAGFITCFIGERNNHGINLVFRKLTRSTIIMSVCLAAFFFFGAPLMPIIYGLENPVTINAAIVTSRITAVAALGFGINYIISGTSSSVEKPVQALLISALDDVFSPLLLSLIFGKLFGYTGIVIGLSVSAYISLSIYSIIYVPRKGKKGFPIFVEDFGEEGVSFDIRVSKESIPEIRDAVYQELTKRGYDIENIELLIEEYYTRIYEKNPGKSVISECTLLFGDDKVRIIIRDDGTLFNFVDENNTVESLNAHVLNSLLERTESKNYLLTTSFNRNGFVFKKVLDSNVA